MERPIAVKMRNAGTTEVHSVSIDAAAAQQLRANGKAAPAVVVTNKAAILASMSAGVIDAEHVIAISDGDWANALLVIVPEATNATIEEKSHPSHGDEEFVHEVRRYAPALADLAAGTIAAVRRAGVDGELVDAGKGRWINRPLNTFTLRPQPRVGNLHFTLYGNPKQFDAAGFLRSDQNSYSRGWIKGESDISRFAELVRQSHSRRKR